MTSTELTNMIDLVIEAVDKSKLGPFFMEVDGKKVSMNSAWETFRVILGCICPKEVTGQMRLEEPKENWEKQ